MSSEQRPASLGERRARIAIGVGGVVTAVVAAGLVLEIRPFTAMWPYPVSHLTYLFLGSVVLAFSAPLVWSAWNDEPAALAGAGMTAACASIGFAVGLAAASTSEPRLLSYAVAGVTVGAVAIAATVWSLRQPFHDPRPTPPVIRVAMAAFAVILVVAGGLIAAGTPNLLPWQIAPESSVLVGWIFVSDAAYFAYGALRPTWANAAGQLIAFAAYDLVLIVPLADHWSTVIPAQRISLGAYLGVLVLSLAVGVFAFVLNPTTRIVRWSAGAGRG